MRFNIADIVAQADDPAVDYSYVEPLSGEVRTAACSRVYHLNLILKYSYSDRRAQAR